MQYVQEKWSIRENVSGLPANHIGESIAHILLTSPREHDTLPAFGSKMSSGIFEPNTTEFELAYQFYLKFSTTRWEKRAIVPDKGGVLWGKTPYLTDQGVLPLHVTINFITQQQQGNLVAPFVTPRQARAQEYPPIQYDSNGHDYYSRYFNRESYDVNGNTCLRFRAAKNIAPASDDQFYRVGLTDTWLLMSDTLYSDIRFESIIQNMWVQDAAAAGASRDILDTTDPPSYGTALRVPSKQRLLTQFATSTE